MADGLALTGRIITAAAAIMFCVFGSFVIKDPLHILKVFGLGLATAVLVDATLVRMVLVPSVMELLGPVNWWLPALAGPLAADHRGRGDAGPGSCARLASVGTERGVLLAVGACLLGVARCQLTGEFELFDRVGRC